MARSTRVISISVPQALAAELELMAQEEGVSKSELVRLMVRSYKRERAETEFLELQRSVAPRTEALGVKSERDVERLVFEGR